jgi:hypothetical protein
MGAFPATFLIGHTILNNIDMLSRFKKIKELLTENKSLRHVGNKIGWCLKVTWLTAMYCMGTNVSADQTDAYFTNHCTTK